MKSSLVFALLVLAGSTLGCTALVGSNVRVPQDAAATCSRHCSDIGLSLDSVVIMANTVGCVCRASGAPAAKTAGSSSGAGGMAAILLEQEAEQQSQQQR